MKKELDESKQTIKEQQQEIEMLKA